MKNVEKSGTFVDKHGELICYVSRAERIWLYIRAIFQALPFVAVFVICGLFIVEFACVLGLFASLSQAKPVSEEFLLYFFVFFVSSIIQFAGLGIGWWLAEHKGLRIQVYPQTHKFSLPIKKITNKPFLL
ncbi:hypothetical protein [Rhodoflexus caldus]|uniref:hypothetical protein n=1 Tax=Rhodoflexus caldus TaxID=2891236 RepID=UPI00202A9D36|nr:hypothetical protein [Rhodoflexus caldus]